MVNCYSRWTAYLLVFAFFFASTVWSQTTATLNGTVADPSGAAVTGADLALQNADTGEQRQILSTENGYSFNLVPPGRYNLTVSHTGFQRVTVQNIVLAVNANVTRNVTLSVGAVSESVSVEAEPVAVNTTSAALGEVIESKRIIDLPLNGRNFLQLAQLSPGATPPPSQIGGSVPVGLTNRGNATSISISGTREASSAYLFDGINSKHDFYGSVGVEPVVDGIAEFKVQRGYFSPEFSLPAVVNVVSKSGSNDIHGSAWEFLRNQKLDARNFFAGTKPPYRQNQYGFVAGGPIIKNKLFGFGTFEQLKIRQLVVATGTVPNPAFLTGDFSSLLPSVRILDPLTYNAQTGTKQPFPGNIIPANRIDPFTQRYNRFIPAPNATGPLNLIGATGLIQDDTRFDIRIDYAASASNKIFARASRYNSPQSRRALLPLAGNDGPMKSWNGVLNWTRVITPNIVNEAMVGLDRVFLYSLAPEKAASSPDWPTVLGLRNISDVKACNTVANVGIAGYSAFGGLTYCIITGNNNYVGRDNLSYTHGRHQLRMGFDLTRVQFWNLSGGQTGGQLTYTGQFTGNGVADYVLGAPFRADGGIPSPPVYYRGTWWGAYLNDDFKVSKNLTINLGLRYQYTQPVTEKYNRQAAFDFKGDGHLLVAGKDIRPGLLTPDRNDWAPRLGIAYAPFGRSDWSIRTSYGIFYDRTPGNEVLWTSQYPPLISLNTLVSDPVVPTIRTDQLWPPFVPGSTLGVGMGLLMDRRSPYLQQWTLSIQHTFSKDMFAEVAYVGSRGLKLSRRIEYNDPPAPPAPGDNRPLQARRPYPNWGYLLSDSGAATSKYHSLQTSFRKASSKGLNLLAAYTWSRSMDTEAFEGSKFYHLGFSSYSRSYFDVRHRAVASLLYEPLQGKFRSGAMKYLLGGWQGGMILTLQTGAPFGVTSSIDSSHTLGSIFAARPNRVCNGNLPPGQRNVNRWFDTSCFVQPPDLTYGNSGFNFLDTNGIVNWDLSANKDFSFTERYHLQFRAEFFNAFNNVNFRVPSAGLQSLTFGRLTSALPARNVQFALKFLW